MTDLFFYVPEAGESFDQLVEAAASTAITGVQEQLDEHEGRTDDPHEATAGQVAFEAFGGIVATDVASALRELDADKLDASHASATDPHNQYLNQSRGDGRYLLDSSRGAASGVAPLDSSSLIPEQYISAVAITDVQEVASEAAMLALTAQRGDVAVRSDLNRSFMLRASPASTLSNWSELRTPTDAVLSVEGLTGAVNLAARYAALSHKARHANGGADPLSPQDIQALGRVRDEGTLVDYSSELDFRGDGVIVSRDATTGRIFITVSGVAAGAASESAAGVVELATAAEAISGASNSLGVHPAGLKASLSAGSWVSPTLTSGWTDFGSGYQTARYKKNAAGRVYVEGGVGGGADGSSATIFTLPSGFRPSAHHRFVQARNVNAEGMCAVEVRSDGRVVPLNTLSGAFVSLSGISFEGA